MNDLGASSVQQQENGKKKKAPLIITILVIIALLAGSVFFFQQRKDKGTTESVKVEEEIPTPTEEKPEIDKNILKIQVLNGTGTPGQAGTATDALKDAGFNSDNITTDNAEDFDHTVTTIAVKEGLEEVAVEIKDALKGIFDEVEIESTTLDKDNEFDIIITTGGKKFEEKKTEVTSSPSPTDSDVSPSPTTAPTATSTTSPTLTP